MYITAVRVAGQAWEADWSRAFGVKSVSEEYHVAPEIIARLPFYSGGSTFFLRVFIYIIINYCFKIKII